MKTIGVALALFLTALLCSLPVMAQDSDGDGMPDAWESSHWCLQPGAADSGTDYDADGMTSGTEYAYSEQLDPCLADSDGDGVSDGDEVGNGSHPLDASITPVFGDRKIGADLRLSDMQSYQPSLVWTGSEFGVVFFRLEEGYYFSRVSSSGDLIGSNQRIVSTLPGIITAASLIWTGSEYGVSWVDYRHGLDNGEIYFTRVGVAGATIGPELRVSFGLGRSRRPALAWSGDRFGIAWDDERDGNTEIYFGLLSPEGSPTAPETRITSSSARSEGVSLAWSGSEYGLSWHDYRSPATPEIYFCRVSSDGLIIGPDLRVSYASGASMLPSLRWTGSEYGLSWFDQRDHNAEIYFARLAPNGSAIGPETRVTFDPGKSDYSSMVWTGSEYGISWEDDRHGDEETYFVRISVEGAKLGSDFRVSHYPDRSENPSIAWNGRDYAVAWKEVYTQSTHFALLRPGNGNAADPDGDGLADDEALYGTDPNDWDSDDDFMPDGWEVTQGAACALDPLADDAAPDADFDGVSNLEEYNLGSDPCGYIDGDGDGMPDDWETFYACMQAGVDDAGLDYNFNGLTNRDEYLAGADPCEFTDTDGDGMPDAWEDVHWCVNRLVADSGLDADRDALTNLEEFQGQTDPCDTVFNDDSDGDGVSDQIETAFGSNPLDPTITPGAVTAGGDVPIGEGGSNFFSDDLAWSGSEFGITWGYGSFSRLSPAGEVIGGSLGAAWIAMDDPDPYPISLAWTGSQYAVAYHTKYLLRIKDIIAFQRITPDAQLDGPTVSIGWQLSEYYAESPSLAWSGSSYGISFHRRDNKAIYFVRVVNDVPGSPISIGASSNNSKTSLAWTGSEYGLSYDNAGSVYFLRLTEAGAKIGTPLPIASGINYQETALAWTGSEYGLSWVNKAAGDMAAYFARLSPAGALTGGPDVIASSTGPALFQDPDLIWTGSEFAIAWTEAPNVYMTILTANGVPAIPKVQVTAASTWNQNPELAWTGSEFGLAWQNQSTGVLFTRVAMDHDGDGLADAAETLTNPRNWDTDGDAAKDAADNCPLLLNAGQQNNDNDALGDVCDPDDDNDGVSDLDEAGLGTDPFNPDSDSDGLRDGDEVLVWGSLPLDPDSDNDSLADGDEVNLFNTIPTDWDSDGDYLSDGYEIANAASLDPLNSLDAYADPDNDGNPTVHEYYNHTNPWNADPFPIHGYQAGCYFWGKSDARPFIGPKDIVEMQKAYAGVPADLSGTMPEGYDPLDVDRDKYPGPGDITTLQAMYAQANRPDGYPSSPSELTVLEAPAPTVAVGGTTHVTLSVHAQGPGAQLFSPGFGVVFWVSTGNAVLLGGEGSDPTSPAGNRYDISMRSDHGAPATMTIAVTGPGPVVINAKVPACGMKPHGRWSDEVVLAAPVVLNP